MPQPSPDRSSTVPSLVLPLIAGADGDAVRDLQARLTALGFEVDAREVGRYGDSTEAAVLAFQGLRGLMVDGRCGSDTWAALVEAGFHLGDRLLYLRRPMLRGDDVGELQRLLGSLGFDAGRVDAIFGPETERALKEFQRNVGMTVDGICGPDVRAALQRLGIRSSSTTAVAGVRERERLRHAPRDLHDRRVVIGDTGGLDALAHAVARSLQDDGARAAVLQHPEPSRQAEQANTFDAEIYVGLKIGEGPCWAAYYATDGFESLGGHQLAELLCAELTNLGLPSSAAHGMRLPILRETRMPAVLVHLGPTAEIVKRTPDLAQRLSAVVHSWVCTPPDT